MVHAPSDGEPVFCLEPQTAAPCAFDGLAVGAVAGVHILETGGRVSGLIRFDVIDREALPGPHSSGAPEEESQRHEDRQR
jgi:hypothetical protein